MSLNDIYDQIDQLTEELLKLIDKMQEYAECDPEASVNKARQIAEMICKRTIRKNGMWEEKFDKNPRTMPELSEMLGSHYLGNKEEIMPRRAYINADVVREWGNIGSHFNPGSRKNLADLLPLLAAVKGLIDWFCQDNGIYIPSVVWQKAEVIPMTSRLHSNMSAPRMNFIGRDRELQEIHDKLQERGNVFVCGMGGIGKSQLVRRYAQQYAAEYDVKIFANYASSLKETIANDSQIAIEDMQRGAAELSAYYPRKMKVFNEEANERVLLVIDNFDVNPDEMSDEEWETLKELLAGRHKLIVTSRMDFAEYENDFGINTLKLGVLERKEEQRTIFFNHYKMKLSEAETEAVDELIELLEGHTMAIEIIAKQAERSRKKPSDMIALLKGKGLHAANFRDRVYHENPREKKNSYEILKALFSLEALTEEEKKILSDLALVPNSGIDTPTFVEWCALESYEDIDSLIKRNWILHDAEEDVIHLHPLVSEVVMGELVKGFPYESRMMKNSFFSNYSEGKNSWVESAETMEKRAAIILRIYALFPQITAENEDQYFVMALTLGNHGGYGKKINSILDAVAQMRFEKYPRYHDRIFEVMMHLIKYRINGEKWAAFEEQCFECIRYLTEHDQYHLAAQFCLSMGYSSVNKGDLERVKNCKELAEKFYHMISPEKDHCGRGIRGGYHPLIEYFGGNVYHFLARCALVLGEPEQALEYQQKAAEILLDPKIYLINERTKNNPEKWMELNRQSISGAFGRIYEALGRWKEAKQYALKKEETLLQYRQPTHENFLSAYVALIRIEQHLGNAEKVTEYKKKLKKLLDANYLPEEAVYRRLTEEYGLDE